MNKAKHAYGSSSNLTQAIEAGKVNAYDVLFLDGDTDSPKIGWMTADGEPVIVQGKDQVVHVDELPTVGNSDVVYICGSNFYFWDGSQFVCATSECGFDEATIDGKIEDAVAETMTQIEAVAGVSEKVKYEFTDVPVGTLVDYSDNEIRVMCPNDVQWSLQSVGEGGDATKYYATFKTYVPSDDVVGYIEHLGDQVDSEILNTFYIDKYGRKYQATWLALASYDASADTWTYYGASSTSNKYIGWDYQIDWYNADGIMIVSDSIRINLANEGCYHSAAPYYMNAAISESKAYTDEQIAKIAAIEVVEF